MTNPVIISSISDLIKNLSADFDDYDGDLWYRGQANTSWGLIPGFYRETNIPQESTLLKKFRQSAAMLLNKEPENSFGWLFLMQHYGLPTRLLDWSESPLIALYFALENHSNYKDIDAALWCMKPSLLNEKAGIKDDTEQYYIPSFEDEELKNYSIEGFKIKYEYNPIATIATRNNPRIQAQQGVFTIHHHRRQTPIEKLDGNNEFLKKYTIPHHVKANILKELKTLGFSKFSLFPELSSISENIKGDFR